MKLNKVDFEFMFRVRKYLENCFRVENECEREKLICNKLSPSIQNEYHFQIYGRKILEIPILKNNFSMECLNAATKIIKRIDIAPEETLINVPKINLFFNFILEIR